MMESIFYNFLMINFIKAVTKDNTDVKQLFDLA